MLPACATNPERQTLLAECQRYPEQFGYGMTYEAWAALGSTSMESPGEYCMRALRNIRPGQIYSA